MQIVLDENKKLGKLVKKDGTVISSYSYKNLIKDDFTFEQFKKDIDSFNETLAKQEEFDDIKELSKYIQIHNF